jgi:uncharacterized protein YebE (UPF0316 family)
MFRSNGSRALVSTAILAALNLVTVQAADRQPVAPNAGAKVIGDSAGRLVEVVTHFDAQYTEALAPLFDTLFEALPIDVCCLVLCPTSASVHAFEGRWAAPQRELGRTLRVENVDRPITIWARDRRIARVATATGLPAALLIPREWPQYGEEQRNDLFVNDLLQRRGLVASVEDTFLHFEGGDLVSNERHVFLGADVLEENEQLGHRRSEIKRELLEQLGRDSVIIGEASGSPPWEHVDMYLTPVGDDTLLVASPTVALMLLSGDPEIDFEVDGVPNAPVPLRDLIDCHSEYDAVADQLAAYDYQIVRLPALAHASDWMITYNNVLIEDRDGCRIVYMPVYQIRRLDQAAEAVYRSLGFEVRRIDVSGIYQWGGALRCMVNVLERDLGEAPVLGLGALTGATVVGDIGLDRVPPAAERGDGEPPPTVCMPVSAAVVPRDVVAPPLSEAGDLPLLSMLWLPVLIFLARVLDVSIGVFRLISLTRGRAVLATGLAAIEVTVWILAVASVLTHLDNWINVVAYIAGYTVGNAVGLWIDRRFGPGMQTISLISRERGAELADGLRAVNLRVTTLVGAGRDGAVAVATLVVPRRVTAQVLNLARAIDPGVVVTVEDVQHANIEDPGLLALAGKVPGTLAGKFLWRRRGIRLDSPAMAPAPESAA